MSSVLSFSEGCLPCKMFLPKAQVHSISACQSVTGETRVRDPHPELVPQFLSCLQEMDSSKTQHIQCKSGSKFIYEAHKHKTIGRQPASLNAPCTEDIKLVSLFYALEPRLQVGTQLI